MGRQHALALLVAACSATPASEAPPALAAHAHAITGADGDYHVVMRAMARAHLVLLGEAAHGTHEFYRERARLTRWLITERRLTALAPEADWMAAARVNRYVRCGREAKR